MSHFSHSKPIGQTGDFMSVLISMIMALMLIMSNTGIALDEIIIRPHMEHPRLLMTDDELEKIKTLAISEEAGGNHLRSDLERHIISTAENILMIKDVLPDIENISAAELKKIVISSNMTVSP